MGGEEEEEMRYERKRIFELSSVRYALLSEIAPVFGQPQLLHVVEVRPDDTVDPHRIPACIEVAEGDEGPYVIVKSNNTSGYPYGRQTRPKQIAIVVNALGADETAREQLRQLDDGETALDTR
jgi:hypothetical protein